jgi:hypothetical protein
MEESWDSPTYLPQELFCPAPEPVGQTLVQWVEQQMWDKYGIHNPEKFLHDYMLHAEMRDSDAVLACDLLLPPGTMDAKLITKRVQDCISYLNKFGGAVVEKHNALRVLLDKKKAGFATDDDEAALVKIKDDYVSMTRDAWKARRTIFEISRLQPIDAGRFHADMAYFIRTWISGKFAIDYPGLAAAML